MCVLYAVPSIIAFARNTDLIAMVILVNFFLGWTGLGWVVALVMALVGDRNTWRPKIKARKRR